MINQALLGKLPDFVEFQNPYNDSNVISYNTGNYVDLYYNLEIQYCTLVTGNADTRGNRVLFQGKIIDINELVFVLNAVKAYCEDYNYARIATPSSRVKLDDVKKILTDLESQEAPGHVKIEDLLSLKSEYLIIKKST